jgi:hypothetical protein
MDEVVEDEVPKAVVDHYLFSKRFSSNLLVMADAERRGPVGRVKSAWEGFKGKLRVHCRVPIY